MSDLCSEYDIKWSPSEIFDCLDIDQRNWGVMQIENSLCEFNKLCNLTENKRMRKRLYTPTKAC